MQKDPIKIKTIVQLYDLLPENERIITDVLRQIIMENLPALCKEKISYNVPFFCGNKEIVSFGQLPFQEVESKKVCYLVFGMAINSKTLTTI